MQSERTSVIDFSMADLSQQLAFINEGRDKFTSEFDYGTGEITKDEFNEILENNLKPDTMISIGLGPKVVSLFNAEGHHLTIVIDPNLNIYLCDPDAPYKPIPIQKNDLNKLSDIIFKYYDNIRSIEIYKYTRTAELRNENTNLLLSLKNNKEILNTFLVCRKGHEYEMMINACTLDSPATLRSILDRLKSMENSPEWSPQHFMNLIDTTLKNNSYRCLEILMNDFCTSTGLSSEDAFKELNIPETSRQHYDNYLKNKI